MERFARAVAGGDPDCGTAVVVMKGTLVYKGGLGMLSRRLVRFPTLLMVGLGLRLP